MGAPAGASDSVSKIAAPILIDPMMMAQAGNDEHANIDISTLYQDIPVVISEPELAVTQLAESTGLDPMQMAPAGSSDLVSKIAAPMLIDPMMMAPAGNDEHANIDIST